MTPEALRQARAASGGPDGRTQRELAALLGVASNTVARWERGDLPIPRWVERMIAVMQRLETVESGLVKERTRVARLRQQLQEIKAERKRAVTRKRP